MTSKRLKKVKRNRKSANKSRRSKVRKSKIVRNRKLSKFGMTDEELLKKEIEKEEQKLSYNYALIEQLFLNRIVRYDTYKQELLDNLKKIEGFIKEIEQSEEKLKPFKKEFDKDPYTRLPEKYAILWKIHKEDLHIIGTALYNNHVDWFRRDLINNEFYLEHLERIKKENILRNL